MITENWQLSATRMIVKALSQVAGHGSEQETD
jgi:hypothetical protein